MAKRYVAGASGLPFAFLRGYVGTVRFGERNIRPITCPFTGEVNAPRVPARDPTSRSFTPPRRPAPAK